MSNTDIPTGTWTVDSSHSEVGFSVRHLMVGKVKGSFESYEATITIADDPLASKVSAQVALESVNTRDEKRDGHLRSADFFDTQTHPNLTFTSTSVEATGDRFAVTGDLSVKGVTRSVVLDLEFHGVHPDPWGGTRAGFTASTEFNRKDFGITFDIPMDGGGVVVGDKIKVVLEVEAVLQEALVDA